MIAQSQKQMQPLGPVGKITSKSQRKPWRFSGVGPLVRAPNEVSRERPPDCWR